MISSQVILWKVSILVMWYYASNCNDYIIFMVYLQKNIYISILYILVYTYTNAVTVSVICFQLNWYLFFVCISEGYQGRK